MVRSARYASRNPVITQHVTNGLTSLSLSGLRDKVTATAELKVYLTDDLDTRLRKAAMSAFGYGRGSLSKAATEAPARWCSERGTPAALEATVPTSSPAPKHAEEINGQVLSNNSLKRSVQSMA